MGQLQSAPNEMSGRLAVVIGEVRSGANALAGASAQVSATAQTLSQGTGEQAASLEETTSSLEEMSASITQNAESSRRTEGMAKEGARNAGAAADHGLLRRQGGADRAQPLPPAAAREAEGVASERRRRGIGTTAPPNPATQGYRYRTP